MLASPVKTKLGCWAVELVLVALLEEPALDDGLKNIQGTATCLPDVPAVDAMPPGELAEDPRLEDGDPGLVEAPGLVEEPRLLADPGLLLVLLVAVPDAPLKEMTATSSRPEAGLTMMSLIVPISLPEELLT